MRPNTLGHSGLVLRLPRCRRNGPVLQADVVRKRIAGHNAPSISNREALDIDLPDYPARRKMNARDPHSVVSGFRVCTYVILPRRLGYFGEIRIQCCTHTRAAFSKRACPWRHNFSRIYGKNTPKNPGRARP